nr:uncharacterized protein LOC129045428 [Mirounga angustirostris]
MRMVRPQTHAGFRSAHPHLWKGHRLPGPPVFRVFSAGFSLSTWAVSLIPAWGDDGVQLKHGRLCFVHPHFFLRVGNTGRGFGNRAGRRSPDERRGLRSGRGRVAQTADQAGTDPGGGRPRSHCLRPVLPSLLWPPDSGRPGRSPPLGGGDSLEGTVLGGREWVPVRGRGPGLPTSADPVRGFCLWGGITLPEKMGLRWGSCHQGLWLFPPLGFGAWDRVPGLGVWTGLGPEYFVLLRDLVASLFCAASCEHAFLSGTVLARARRGLSDVCPGVAPQGLRGAAWDWKFPSGRPPVGRPHLTPCR